MQKITASIKDQDIFSQTINLSELFRPDTFLNALRQQTARATKQPMDALVLNTSWSGEVKHGKNVSIKITGLQLEGCSFEGGRLTESAPDSPSVTSFPSCYIAWIPQVGALRPFLDTSMNFSFRFSLGCCSTRDTRNNLVAGLLQCIAREDGHAFERAVRHGERQMASMWRCSFSKECLGH